MNRTFLLLLFGLVLACAANAGELSSPVPDKASSPDTGRPFASPDASPSLHVPAEPVRLDWVWQSEADYGAAGDLLVGSGVSYVASRAFSLGGTYAMAVRPKVFGRQDLDPARYTFFMRWQF